MRYILNIRKRIGYKIWIVTPIITFLLACGVYLLVTHKPENEFSQRFKQQEIQFDKSVSLSEKSHIKEVIKEKLNKTNLDVSISVKTISNHKKDNLTINVFVPVSNQYSAMQNISLNDLSRAYIYNNSEDNETVAKLISQAVNTSLPASSILRVDSTGLSNGDILLLPITKLSSNVRLLNLDDSYYLDTFSSGGISRVLSISGRDASKVSSLDFSSKLDKASVLKVNMTGVTALTRVMLQKLRQNNDPLYFSRYIGKLLSDADITHISNEVSFKPSCEYSSTSFCSDPRFIETLKDIGVDLVEITGNHNNDQGSEYNFDTINLYKNLGWQVIGGGINTNEASKPFIASNKQSKIAFLAYNYADSPNGIAIAGPNHAGANKFDLTKMKQDIENAKEQADFVIVDIQFLECYAYPDNFTEFPECDKPISGQQETFRSIIDLGANMVVGTAAHQPQIYEFYKGAPIYYGLGNLFFDQTRWPGTERGMVLTHYFHSGKLLQTKITPTIYNEDLQTQIMPEAQSNKFLQRLNER